MTDELQQIASFGRKSELPMRFPHYRNAPDTILLPTLQGISIVQPIGTNYAQADEKCTAALSSCLGEKVFCEPFLEGIELSAARGRVFAPSISLTSFVLVLSGKYKRILAACPCCSKTRWKSPFPGETKRRCCGFWGLNDFMNVAAATRVLSL